MLQSIYVSVDAGMRGFIQKSTNDNTGQKFELGKPEAREKPARRYQEGKLKYKENPVKGFENLPSAFIGLFTGENIGKRMVKFDNTSLLSFVVPEKKKIISSL